jgi:hypothetical protein
MIAQELERVADHVFVPDLVTAFTVAPECVPFSAERPLVATRNSCSASGKGNGRFRLSYVSLCIAPSST